jgi:hypothetical protein
MTKTVAKDVTKGGLQEVPYIGPKNTQWLPAATGCPDGCKANHRQGVAVKQTLSAID